MAHDLDVPLVDAIAGAVSVTPADAVLDVGCGEGQHLAALVARWGCEGHGLDISAPAIDAAARGQPRLHWVVANADRWLPYANASFALVTSILARRNATEFRRVLRDDGHLLLVVPAPDDLIELREAVLGEGLQRDRVPDAVTALDSFFTLVNHDRHRHVAHLEPAAIADVMAGSYRGLRARARARLATVGALDVTLSRDLLLLRPKA